MEKKTCVICGKYSGKYPLCFEHMQMKNAGKVVKCSSCGKWHYSDMPCDCQKKSEGQEEKEDKYAGLPTKGHEKCLSCGAETNGYAFCHNCWKKYTREEMLAILKKETKEDSREQATEGEPCRAERNELHGAGDGKREEEFRTENTQIVIDSGNRSKCITCGKKTDGLLFCPFCYQKYKNKELLFKITNCTNVELLDDSYEGRYTCKDGHVVKSKSERDIDNYLFEHGISHAYEKELPYGATEKEILHPDFFLPNYLGKDKHVYLEHWGYNENNLQYTKTKKFKMPIYRDLGVTLICTYEKSDSGKIDSVLDRKLNDKFIKENQINYEE